MKPYDLVLRAEDVYKKRILIEVSEQYSRKKCHEDTIEKEWQKALQSKATVYNATKYRLSLPILIAEDTVTMKIGFTDYREYLGTNRSEALEELRTEGKSRFSDEHALLSNALGCEALLLTSDGFLLLLRRSSCVATHNGLYNGPSGHAEPSRVLDASSTTDHYAELLRESIRFEITEETGLEPHLLSEPQLIGVMLDTFSKPDFLFLVKCQADCSKIESAAKDAIEGWESDDFVFLPLAAALSAPDSSLLSYSGQVLVSQQQDEKVLIDLQLTPVTQAALQCLRAYHTLRGYT